MKKICIVAICINISVFPSLCEAEEALLTAGQSNTGIYPLLASNWWHVRDLQSCSASYTVQWLNPQGSYQQQIVNLNSFSLGKDEMRKVVGYFNSTQYPAGAGIINPRFECF